MGYTKFKIRTTKPEKNNPNYTKTRSGGKIKSGALGKPLAWTDATIGNCIGYARGRWLEVHEELTGDKTDIFPYFNCDAENAITWAKRNGLETGDIPRPMSLACFAKGKAGVHEDGAGHIFPLEQLNEDGSCLISESGYGSYIFRTRTINNKNGKWGMGSGYTFRGFIYHPDIKWTEETPTFKEGDKVLIVGKGNGNSFGTGKSAKSGGKTIFTILKVYADRPFPYAVGLVKNGKKETRGFYKESAIKKV